MASANLSITTAIQTREPVDDRHGWGFAILLLLMSTLFLRPADLIPALDKWPVYQFLILCCLVVGTKTAVRTLTLERLVFQPATASMLALLGAVALSHLSHGFFWAARNSLYEVSKLFVLYLLIVGLVNTSQRLTLFLRWLTMSICFIAMLAILDHFEIISVSALEPIRDRGSPTEGDDQYVERIRGTGIFQDPNDFGLILVTGLVFCASFLTSPRRGLQRYLWLLPLGLTLAALALTHSRGALLSLLCAIPAAVLHRHAGKLSGWPLLLIPLLALVFSSRMTDISSLHEGTGQSRIQIWSDSLLVWRQNPVFGLGQGLLQDELGVGSHNSILHCFAELGLLGGAAFLACLLAAGLNLWSLKNCRRNWEDTHTKHGIRQRELLHHGSFIFAALVGYAAGMMTISRQFVPPTYVMIGLATTTTWVLNKEGSDWRLGNRFLVWVCVCTVASILTFYVAVRLLVHW